MRKLLGADPLAAVEEIRVHKVGRTTGYTTDTVFNVSADVKVQYDAGIATLQDQVLIHGDGGKPFAAPGDSGSGIVDRATRRVTALLFAGSDTYTLGNHILNVLDQLRVSVVSGVLVSFVVTGAFRPH